MPRGDGTGPIGQGAMTGRGLGACTGVNAAPFGNGLRRGIGLRCGSGFRRGYGAYYYNQPINNQPINSQTQKEALENQKQFYANQLDNINKQLEDM